MNTNTKNLWSRQAWETALPVYRKILEHPFVQELAQGTLAAEKFRFYLRQDSLYLGAYARVLSHIASRLNQREHTAAFLRFASDGIAVEQALHRSYLHEDIRHACFTPRFWPARPLPRSKSKPQRYYPVSGCTNRSGSPSCRCRAKRTTPTPNGSARMPTLLSRQPPSRPSPSAMPWRKMRPNPFAGK